MADAVEMLLVASATDRFAITAVDPRSGVASWSLKGSELQGALCGAVEPLGSAGEHLLVAAGDRPVAHVVAVHARDNFDVKSVLAAPLEYVVAHPDGAAIFASSGTRIFTWLVSTGELLSVVEAHYQRVSCLRLAPRGEAIVSGSDDGAVKVFPVSDLMCSQTSSLEAVRPLREWRAHSLRVTDVRCSRCAPATVLSCSADHTAALHSIALDECLLKISCDRSLTACCINAAESRLFFGTNRGDIVQLEVESLIAKSDHMVVVGGAEGQQGFSGRFDGHVAEIRQLCLNADASMLAVGDSEGRFSIFDVASKQCLNSSVRKGCITKLLFVPNWPSLHCSEYPKTRIAIGVLQQSRKTDTNDARRVVLRARPRRHPHTKEEYSEDLRLLLTDRLTNLPEDSKKNEQPAENAGKYSFSPRRMDGKAREGTAKKQRAKEGDALVVQNADEPPSSNDVDTLKKKLRELRAVNMRLSATGLSLLLSRAVCEEPVRAKRAKEL